VVAGAAALPVVWVDEAAGAAAGAAIGAQAARAAEPAIKPTLFNILRREIIF